MSAQTPGPGWSVNTKQDWIIAAVIVALVLFFAVVWPHPTATKAAHRTPTDLWHVKVNYAALQFGCRSKAELQRITCYSAEGDQRASMRLFGLDMVSGACRSFRSGEPVFVSDTEAFGGLVRVRRKGPLSPLLASVLLDEVDRELERRGHHVVRYADDCNVYVRSPWAGDRVMELLRDLYGKLRLQINESKSAVTSASGRKFLGYALWAAPGRRGQARRVPQSPGNVPPERALADPPLWRAQHGAGD